MYFVLDENAHTHMHTQKWICYLLPTIMGETQLQAACICICVTHVSQALVFSSSTVI